MNAPIDHTVWYRRSAISGAWQAIAVGSAVSMLAAFVWLVGLRQGWYGSEFGVVIFLLSNISVFIGFSFWLGRRRHHHEHELRAQINLREAIVDGLGEGVVVTDLNGNFIVFNRPAVAITGRGMTTAPARQWGQYYGVFQEDQHTPIGTEEFPLMRALRGIETHDEVQFLRNEARQDGVFISVNGAPLHDENGAHIGAIAVFRDISEARHNRLELERVARFDQIQQNALQLFNAIKDRTALQTQTLALLAQQQHYPVLAFYRYDDWLGRYKLECARGAPANIAPEIIPGVGMLGQIVSERRLRLIHDGVEQLHLDTGLGVVTPQCLLACPVINQERPVGFLLLTAMHTIDDAEQTFIEHLCGQWSVALRNIELYEDLKLLADQLQKRSDEIGAKNSELERASRLKSEFLANMSHELRTPLNAVIGFSEALRDGLLGAITAPQRTGLDDIFHAANHLLALINDILDLSRIEAGEMALQCSAIDFNGAVDNALILHRERAADKNIRLFRHITAPLPAVQADLRRLKQMLYNLVSNAVKFTEQNGEVHLQVDTLLASELALNERPGFRCVITPRSGATQFVRILIRDTGIGIANEQLPQLFQPFHQLDSEMARRYEGSGLGLALVARLIDLHDGGLTVSSDIGHGSTFSLYFPCAEANQNSTPLEHGISDAAALIIEDDAVMAQRLRQLLAQENWIAEIAGDAASARACLARQPYALIVLDLLLPDGDGWQLFDGFRQHKNSRDAAVVVVSVLADQARGLAMGASAVLSEPFGDEELRSALRGLQIDAISASREQVLILDDDPRAVEIIALPLQAHGYRVRRAYDGDEALRSLREAPVDLVIVDLLMPQMNGAQFIEQLRQDGHLQTIPILILTAKQLSVQEREQWQRRGHSVLQKTDFHREHFVHEVRRVLHKPNTEVA